MDGEELEGRLELGRDSLRGAFSTTGREWVDPTNGMDRWELPHGSYTI